MDIEARISNLLSSQPVVPDYNAKLSCLGRGIFHPEMRKKIKSEDQLGVIKMSIGQPHSAMNPVASVNVRLKDGKEISIDEKIISDLSYYNHCEGRPELRELLSDIQMKEHKPPQMVMKNHPSKFDLIVTCGVTHSLQACSKLILDIDGSDTVLLDEVGYVTFIGSLKCHGANIQTLDFDEEGVLPDALEDLLRNWNQRHPGRKMPKMLYTVTASHNPVGFNWSLSRMLDVYLICRKYDILIFDDGAYYYLQFGERPRSFQSLDIDGRVLRFDTFSKIIGASHRVGWLSGPNFLLEKVVFNIGMTCVHAGLLSQAVIYALLKNWGPDGFQKQVRTVANFYKRRAECVMNAFDKYLSGLATWTVPKGGMFTWVSIKDIVNSGGIVDELEENGVSVVEGKFFQPDERANNSFRLCFALASEEDMVKGIKCLAEIIQRKKSKLEG